MDHRDMRTEAEPMPLREPDALVVLSLRQDRRRRRELGDRRDLDVRAERCEDVRLVVAGYVFKMLQGCSAFIGCSPPEPYAAHLTEESAPDPLGERTRGLNLVS